MLGRVLGFVRVFCMFVYTFSSFLMVDAGDVTNDNDGVDLYQLISKFRIFEVTD